MKEFKNDPKRAFGYIPVGCAAGIDHSMKEACGSENAAFLDGNMLRVDFKGEEVELVAEGDLLIKGEHNVSNALAAAAAALACGVDAAQVREGLVSFKPLEHRLEPCGEIGGGEVRERFQGDQRGRHAEGAFGVCSSHRHFLARRQRQGNRP